MRSIAAIVSRVATRFVSHPGFRTRTAGTSVLAFLLLVLSSPAASTSLARSNDTAGVLTLEITANPDPVRTNERLTYELLVCNSGATELTGVGINAVVPTGLVYTGRTDGGTCSTGACATGATLGWNLGALAGNSCRMVGMTSQVTAPDGAQVAFEATASADGGVTVSDTLTVDVETSPALSVELEDGADPIAPGGVLTYTIAFGNRSSGNVLGASLKAAVPAGTTLLSVEDGGSESGGEITWTLGTLEAGAAGRRRFSVTVDQASLDGTALVAGAELTGSAGEAAHATQATAIDGGETLNIHMTATPDPIATSARVIYDITACNAGDLDATGATVDILLPNGLVYTAGTDGATCSSGACGTGSSLTWNLGTLGAGHCRTLQATSQITTANDGELIRPAARLIADGGALAVATRALTRLASQQLGLALTEDLEPVSPSGTLAYTVSYGVPTASANVLATILRAWVPPGATVTSISGGGTEADGVITWNLGTLQSGESGQRRFVVSVNENVISGAALDAVAEIDADSGATFGALASQTTAVREFEPISLKLTAAPDTIRPNERIIYDLTVCNAGQLEATNVVTDMLLPGGVVYSAAGETATCSSGACGTGSQVKWILASLGAGRCRTYQLTTQATFATSGLLIATTARVQADGESMAVAARTVAVDSAPQLGLALTEDQEPTAADRTLTYTLTASNRSATNATNTQLSITLPQGTAVGTISDDGVATDNVVTWSLGTFQAGDNVQRRVSVVLDQGLLDGTSIVAESELTSGTTDRFSVHAGQATSIVSSDSLTLRLTAAPDTVRTNERALYALTVCNSADLDATGVLASMVLPNGVVYSSGVDGAVCTSGACATGSRVSWDLGTLAAKRCRTVELSTQATFTTDGELIPMSARVIDDDASSVVAGRVIAIDNAPSLMLTLADDHDPTAAARKVTYTLTASNRAVTNVSNAELRFEAPVGTTIDTEHDGGTLEGNVVTWSLGTFVAGDSLQRRVVVTVSDVANDGTSLIAESQLTGGTTDRISVRAAEATSSVSSEPLTLDMIASPDPVRTNERVVYELTACNASELEATGVTIDSRLPNGVVSTTRSDDGVCTSGACATGSYVSWDIGGLASGRCRTVAMSTQATATAVGEILPLTARVQADGGTFAMDGRAVVVDTNQKLTAAVVENSDPAAPASTTTYKVTVGNRGTSTLTDGELRVHLPTGATFSGASNGGVALGDIVYWPLCPIAAGKSGTLQFSVLLDDTATLPDGSAITTDAQVAVAEGNPPASHADAATGVLDQSPLRLTLAASPTAAAQAAVVIYSLSACNDSLAQATGVLLSMYLPRGTLLSSIEDGGVQVASGEIQWTLPTLDAGTCTDVTLHVTMASGASYVGDGSVIFSSARMIVDGGETAVAHTSIRACNSGTCSMIPPLPCGAPQTHACSRTASDALAILRTAVNLRQCPLCECDVDSSTKVTASDALILLKYSVGSPITLNCPPCE